MNGLNLPIALNSWWFVGGIEVWHLLVVVKWKDSPNDVVTRSDKPWLESAPQ